MSDHGTQTVHGCLKTPEGSRNYAVLYGDELARADRLHTMLREKVGEQPHK